MRPWLALTFWLPLIAMGQQRLAVSQLDGWLDHVPLVCYQDAEDTICQDTGENVDPRLFQGVTELVVFRKYPQFSSSTVLCGIRDGFVQCDGENMIRIRAEGTGAHRHSFGLGRLRFCFVENGAQRCLDHKGNPASPALPQKDLQKVVRTTRNHAAYYCGLTTSAIHCAFEDGGSPVTYEVNGATDLTVGGDYASVCAIHEKKVKCWNKAGVRELPDLQHPVDVMGVNWASQYYSSDDVCVLHGEDPKARYISCIAVSADKLERFDWKLEGGIKEMSPSDFPLCAITNRDEVWCRHRSKDQSAKYPGMPGGTNPRFLESADFGQQCVRWDQDVHCLDKWDYPEEPRRVLESYVTRELVATMGIGSVPGYSTCLVFSDLSVHCLGEIYSLPPKSIKAERLELQDHNLYIMREGALLRMSIPGGNIQGSLRQYRGTPFFAGGSRQDRFWTADEEGLWRVESYGSVIDQERWFTLPHQDPQLGRTLGVSLIMVQADTYDHLAWACRWYEKDIACQKGQGSQVEKLGLHHPIHVRAKGGYLCASDRRGIHCFNDQLKRLGTLGAHGIRPHFTLSSDDRGRKVRLFVLDRNLVRRTWVDPLGPLQNFFPFGEEASMGFPLDTTRNARALVRWVARVGSPSDEAFLYAVARSASNESPFFIRALESYFTKAADEALFVTEVGPHLARLKALATAAGAGALSAIPRTPEILRASITVLTAAVETSRTLVPGNLQPEWERLSPLLADLAAKADDSAAFRVALLSAVPALEMFYRNLEAHPILRRRVPVARGILSYLME